MARSRSVVITGASRGLGLASSAHLYKQGWRVVGAMRSLDQGLDNLRTATGAAPGDPRLIGVKLDLSDPESIVSAAKAVTDAVGAPDVVVHNAGVAASGCTEELPSSVWEDMFQTNLFGPVRLTKELLPAMRAAGRGRIVVISSQGGIRGMPSIPAYSASKGALERWAEALAGEIAPFGIGVTVLVTGSFKTEILTEKTPDYGDLEGPYAAQYAGMRRTGGAMVEKASPPELFARKLAKALDDRAPFTRHPVGPDAVVLSITARLLPGTFVHNLLRRALGLPGFGELHGSAQMSSPSLTAQEFQSPQGK